MNWRAARWGLLLAVASPAAAQQPLVTVPLDSGTIIRLTFRDGPPVQGRLIARFAAESAGFRYAIGYRISEYRTTYPGIRYTPTTNVASVDVRVGSHSGSGALIGAAVGVGFGLVGYNLFNRHCGNCSTGLGFGVASVGALSALAGSQIGGRSHVWLPAAELPPLPATGVSLDSGTIVRLEYASGARVSGTLLSAFRPDSNAFVYCAYPVRQPCQSLDDRYVARTAADAVRDIRVRERSRAPEAAVLGILAGMIGGITACQAIAENNSCNGASLLLVSGAFGAFVGVMAGSATGVWQSPL